MKRTDGVRRSVVSRLGAVPVAGLEPAGGRGRPIVALLVGVGLWLGRPGDAAGQTLVNHGALDNAQPNVVHVRTGLQYGFIAGLDYGRGFALGGRTLIVSGGVTLPWAELDRRDYGARVGAAIDIFARDGWRLIGGLGANVRGTRSVVSRMTSLAADGAFVAGYWSPRWFVAAEVGYDGAIATHVRHTDYYRALFHADARDGWYVDTGANIHAGAVVGRSFGRYDLMLRAGHARDRWGNHQMLPAYATVGISRRF